MEILDFDILLSEEKIKNAIFIPCYDDFGYMAWKSPEIFEIIQEIFLLERLISGVDVWVIERKKEYVLNSEDKIELCELSWYYSNNYRDDLKINQKQVSRFILKTNQDLTDKEIAYSLSLLP